MLVKENELLFQTNTSLHLQILELQKFIYGGKQEKFKPDPNSNALQTTSFDKDKLGDVVVESMQHVKAHDIKKTVTRVNHPRRKPLSDKLWREEVRLLPTEDATGLTAVGELNVYMLFNR